jgi:hypothetical protein
VKVGGGDHSGREISMVLAAADGVAARVRSQTCVCVCVFMCKCSNVGEGCVQGVRTYVCVQVGVRMNECM